MTPLDLRNRPPRAPRAMLADIVFLPRSIDKLRATLPGGDLGDYTIAGITQSLFDRLGIPFDAMRAAVESAGDESDVAQFVLARATREIIAAWNAEVAIREPRGGNRTEALAAFAWLADRPDLIFALDILEEDDKRHFAATR